MMPAADQAASIRALRVPPWQRRVSQPMSVRGPRKQHTAETTTTQHSKAYSTESRLGTVPVASVRARLGDSPPPAARAAAPRHSQRASAANRNRCQRMRRCDETGARCALDDDDTPAERSTPMAPCSPSAERPCNVSRVTELAASASAIYIYSYRACAPARHYKQRMQGRAVTAVSRRTLVSNAATRGLLQY